MTDNEQKPEVTVTFSVPDVITIGIWDTYSTGKQAYRTAQEKAGKTVTELVAQYWGALALIEAGTVHVKGAPDELSRWLTSKERDTTPLYVVWFVCQEVAARIEAGFFAALPWVKPATTSPNGSSPTS